MTVIRLSEKDIEKTSKCEIGISEGDDATCSYMLSISSTALMNVVRNVGWWRLVPRVAVPTEPAAHQG